MPYRDRPRTRTERLGESFKSDPRYENLITMTPERRETILQTSPVTRIAFGSYIVARDAARDLEKERAR
jgi:hypothetical protein